MKQRRVMIQQSPGCDDPDLSVFQGSRSLEMLDGPRRERRRREKTRRGRRKL